MKKFTNIRRTAALVAVLTVAGLAVGPVSRVGAASFPAHAPGSVSCDSGTATITAYPPARSAVTSGTTAHGYMYSFYAPPGRERVLWSSSLSVWNGSQWVLYDNSAPWLYAFANQNGLQSWYFNGSYVWSTSRNDGIAIDRHDYRNLYRGYYRVWNYFSWSSIPGTDSLLAAKYNGVVGASYCFIG